MPMNLRAGGKKFPPSSRLASTGIFCQLPRVDAFLQSFAMTYAALFPIANPLGNAAIFLSITPGEKSTQRRSQALKGSLYMFGILLLFFVAGNFVMRFFGITLDGVRVAGGLVVAHVGFKLMNPKKEDTHTVRKKKPRQKPSRTSLSHLSRSLCSPDPAAWPWS